MSRRQLAVYSRRGFTEEAILQVGAQSYRSRGPEKDVSRIEAAGGI